jgi:hypothetical protein
MYSPPVMRRLSDTYIWEYTAVLWHADTYDTAIYCALLAYSVETGYIHTTVDKHDIARGLPS